MKNIAMIVGIILLTILGYIIYQTIINLPNPTPLLFNGTGYTTFAPSGDYNTTTTQFSCNLKTEDGDGLILYGKADDDDMFFIKLSGGSVVTEIDTGSGVVTLTSNVRVNNGEWHSVKLIRDDKHIFLAVDDETLTGHTGPMTGITRPNIIYVGGSNLDISNAVKGFVGCLKNLKFGNKLAKDIEFDFTVGGVTVGSL